MAEEEEVEVLLGGSVSSMADGPRSALNRRGGRACGEAVAFVACVLSILILLILRGEDLVPSLSSRGDTRLEGIVAS